MIKIGIIKTKVYLEYARKLLVKIKIIHVPVRIKSKTFLFKKIFESLKSVPFKLIKKGKKQK